MRELQLPNPAANVSMESQDFLLDDGLLNQMPDIDDLLKYDVKEFQQDKDGKMTMEFGLELDVPGFSKVANNKDENLLNKKLLSLDQVANQITSQVVEGFDEDDDQLLMENNNPLLNESDLEEEDEIEEIDYQ